MALGNDERPLYEIKANLFKGLAHPYRIRVLEASHLSQHLSVLRRYGLVVSERRASVVYYRLTSAHVADLLRVARALLGEILQDSQRHHDSALALPVIAPGR